MLVLSRADVEALLDLDALIDAIADALADLSAGRAAMPDRTAALIDPATATGLLDMPCWVPSSGALISKLVTIFPGNAAGPLPVRQAVAMAFDPENGTPAALMDATYLMAARTGACSALSARLLARPDAEVLAVLGTGPQARAHLLAQVRVRPFREIRLAGRDHAKAVALAADLSGVLGRPVDAVDGFERALDGADVVAAATYAAEPVVRHAWLAPGTHVSSVGYNPRGRELDDDLVAGAALFVESRHAALNAVPPNRDIAEPLERGLIDIRAELGEVVSGSRPGRLDPEEITLYKSVGVAVQDAAAVALVLAAARKTGAGQQVSI